MPERLYSFIEKEQLLFEGQFVFRNNRSTPDILLDITENIRDACDKEHYTRGAFLDFRKAFNTVNHDILLKIRTHYRISTAKNPVILSNFLVWKFCGKALFPHSFHTKKLGETTRFFAV